MQSFDIIRHTPRDTDNYNYLLRIGNEVLWVDPLYPLALLKRLDREGWTVRGILVTHTHWDHIDGIDQVRERWPVPVYVHPLGVSDLTCDGIVEVIDGDTIEHGSMQLTVHYLPGHHSAHLMFRGGGCAVLGDILFAFGCGSARFGGDAHQIYQSLQRLPSLLRDDDLLLWGHRYDLTNLHFARYYWPDDAELGRWSDRQAALTEESLPAEAKWQEQRLANPFLRCHEPALYEALLPHVPTLVPDAESVFLALRELRNSWRGEP